MSTTPVLVASPEAIAQLALQLAQAPLLAIDIESNGLHAYAAGLCTIQILSVERGELFVVDSFRVSDAALLPLAPVLGAQGPRKIVHDISFDARILAEHGLVLGNVFDTALAARFLGAASTGLAGLALERLGLTVSKKLQHHDWGKRPLLPEQIAYLAGDVLVLPPIAQALEAEIIERGIVAELDAETRYRLLTAQRDTAEADPRPAYVRIKLKDELSAVAYAVLREVAAVREAEAKKLDVPPFKVVDNVALIALAQTSPRTRDEVGRIRGLQHGRALSLVGALFDAVQRGLQAGDVPKEERAQFLTAPPRPPRAQAMAQREREARLSAWRKAEAKRRKVDDQAILPGHVLRGLAEKAPTTLTELTNVEGLGQFRVDREGAALLELIRGKQAGLPGM